MLLNNRYLTQDPIGRGGLATIYLGIDTHTNQVVAIKMLREVYSTDPKFVTRFQREAKVMASFQHPNIIKVYDYGQSDGKYFMVEEFIEGTDLRRYLRSRGPLDADNTVKIAHGIALGLGAVHSRSIIHRNVKPTNILLGRDGSIKLTDFCVAVMSDMQQYYSPEQAQGHIVIPSADVYSLGIVMYQMVTGRVTFDGDTPYAITIQHIQDTPVPPSQHTPNIPASLEEIILRCLEKSPDHRYRDGSELARALESLGGYE